MHAHAVIALVGCTATGKTAVAERVAAELNGEVVCADSRQVFRELDIGTGKPSREERARLPHHLFASRTVAAYAPDADEAGPESVRATAGWYARAAREVCAGIHARGRVPVLVGGSGLYLGAARNGLAPTPEVDPEVRVRIARQLAAEGPAGMHARLVERDPEGARTVRASDPQRVSRALEVLESTGKSILWWRERPANAAVDGEWITLQLVMEPGALRQRIEHRTRWMFEHGLIEETRALTERGLGPALERLRAIGYDEALALSAGRLDRAAAEERTRLRTNQLAKRQRTWFRHQLDSVPVPADSGSPEQLADVVLARFRRGG